MSDRLPKMDLKALDLCQFCYVLVKFRPDDASSRLPRALLPHHPTLDLLVLSSETCCLCSTIASLGKNKKADDDIYEEHLIKATTSDTQTDTASQTRKPHSVSIIVVSSRLMASGAWWTFVEVEFMSNSVPLLLEGRSLTIVTCLEVAASEQKMRTSPSGICEKTKTIRSWLDNCRSSSYSIADSGHQNCRPIPFAPLRLIDVGSSAGTTVKLVQPPPTMPAEYTALSHCWGRKPPIQTNKENLSGFSHEIPLEVLPKTFSDAIQMTLDLGIRHIWIDSLCIVQDDEQEWQDEAARMDSIYRGSQLCIAAVQSDESSGGLFPDINLVHNNGLLDGEMLFRTPSTDADGPQIQVRVYVGDVRHHSTMSYSPLSSRGWTLQEQLLPHRIAWCMQPEVHWGCEAGYQTEGSLQFTPAEMLDSLAPWRTLVVGTQAETVTKTWHQIVENYSARRFTFPRDRVVAIAGITRHIGAAANKILGQSILGLWEKSISRSLAWLRDSEEPDPDFLALAVSSSLPSWSWLACPGKVAYDEWRWDDKRKMAGSVVDDHVRLVDWDVFWDGRLHTSAVISGYLKVEGPVCEIPIASATGDRKFVSRGKFQVFGENRNYDGLKSSPWRCSGCFDRENDSANLTPRTYLCLLLRSRTVKTKMERLKGEWRFDEIFLILEPVGMPEEGKYRRLGLAKMWGETPSFDRSQTKSLVLV
ncbi:heterokaryon incompatibility protein-domain-containing protein [Podospora didyma]|uniref:Heterokaryon incompatibility protein-domain-containing protein n=1 Tax=Podospora didyma TaxID=330526 RepID=A0AAE0K750_9PEZI|nr:heterokaryon incompatibility protein-domain-containing protein [Podospora didyma]